MIARLDCSSTIFREMNFMVGSSLAFPPGFQTGAFERGGDILSGSPMPFAAFQRPRRVHRSRDIGCGLATERRLAWCSERRHLVDRKHDSHEQKWGASSMFNLRGNCREIANPKAVLMQATKAPLPLGACPPSVRRTMFIDIAQPTRLRQEDQFIGPSPSQPALRQEGHVIDASRRANPPSVRRAMYLHLIIFCRIQT